MQLRKIQLLDTQPLIFTGQHPGYGKRFRILIHDKQPAVRPESAQDFAAMSAATEGGIDIYSVRLNTQLFHCVIKQYRYMRHTHPL